MLGLLFALQRKKEERKITINGCALAVNTCVICVCDGTETKVQKLF